MDTSNDIYDSDDELDWEEVDVPHAQHIEITLNPSTKGKEKEITTNGAKSATPRKGISPAQRRKRISCHQIHTISLVANGWIRNRWINDELLQACLLSLTPLALQDNFAVIHKSRVPDSAKRGRMFQVAISRLVEWWSGTFFEVMPRGHLRNRSYDDVQEGLASEGHISSKQPPRTSNTPSEDDIPLTVILEGLKDLSPIDHESLQATLNDDGEFIRSSKSLLKHALMRSGSRDTSAQLFTSLCRSLGIPARLVVSVQSVPWKSTISATKPKPKPKGKAKDASTPQTTPEDSPKPMPKVTRKVTRKTAVKPVATRATRSQTKPKTNKKNAKKKGKAAAKQQSDDERSYDNESDDDFNSSSAYSPSTKSTASSSSRQRQFRGTASKSSSSTPLNALNNSSSAIVTPPVFWTEVYSKGDSRWLPVDPIRCIINKRKVFDPTQLSGPIIPPIYRSLGASASRKQTVRPTFSPKTAENRMVYVLAFEEDGYARDVTRRYAREYAVKVAKMQDQGDGTRRVRWWQAVLGMIHRPYRLHRDDVEDEELEAVQVDEGMPTTVAGFKDHPLYVLTRHLHVNQVIYPEPPETPEVGKFRGESVYPRSAVVDLKTSENWLRSEGRVVKPGCQPLKSIKARVSTVNKLRAIEALKEAGAATGGEATQGLYARDQTEPFVPNPIVDGVVPKNNYGNIDLYVPSMLPPGGVHVPLRGAWKVARKLGFDYAEAVTGFHFRCRRAMPLIDGIVIAAENEAVLLEAYAEAEQEAEKKARTQREERVIKRWKRLIQGLQIRQRLQSQYQDKPLEIQVQVAEGSQNGISADQVPHGDQGGGFLVEADDVVQPFHLPSNIHPVLPSFPSHLTGRVARAHRRNDVGEPSEDEEANAEPLVLGTMDLDSDIDESPSALARSRTVPKSMKELVEGSDETTDELDTLSGPPLSLALDEEQQLQREPGTKGPLESERPRAQRKTRVSVPAVTRSSARISDPPGVNIKDDDGALVQVASRGTRSTARQSDKTMNLDDHDASASTSPRVTRSSARRVTRKREVVVEDTVAVVIDTPPRFAHSSTRLSSGKRKLGDSDDEAVIPMSTPTRKRQAKVGGNEGFSSPSARVLRPRASKSQSQLRK